MRFALNRNVFPLTFQPTQQTQHKIVIKISNPWNTFLGSLFKLEEDINFWIPGQICNVKSCERYSNVLQWTAGLSGRKHSWSYQHFTHSSDGRNVEVEAGDDTARTYRASVFTFSVPIYWIPTNFMTLLPSCCEVAASIIGRNLWQNLRSCWLLTERDLQ